MLPIMGYDHLVDCCVTKYQLRDVFNNTIKYKITFPRGRNSIGGIGLGLLIILSFFFFLIILSVLALPVAYRSSWARD